MSVTFSFRYNSSSLRFGLIFGVKGPIDSNRSFPVMSIFFSIVLAAFETLRHKLDFRSSVSCLGFGYQTCGWAIWITTFATNLVSCSVVKVNV